MTDRHGPVVSAREAPPLSASAGRDGFVPVAPQLFQPSTFVYPLREAFDVYGWGVDASRIAAEAFRRRMAALDRRLVHHYGPTFHHLDARPADKDLKAWRTLGCGGLKLVP